MLLHQNVFIVAAAFVAVTPISTSAEFTKDSLKAVKRNVDSEKAVLVDVRSEKEWEDGHIEGSIFLPVTALVDQNADVEALTKDLPGDKILYTFCVVGMRAEGAGEVLSEMGYKVRVLEPGYQELLKAGFTKAKEEAK
jgi:phage shock protein E